MFNEINESKGFRVESFKHIPQPSKLAILAASMKNKCTDVQVLDKPLTVSDVKKVS